MRSETSPVCVKHSLMGDSGPSRWWLCSAGLMLSFLCYTSCSPCCGWNYLGATCLHEHLHSVSVPWLSTLCFLNSMCSTLEYSQLSTESFVADFSWAEICLEYPGKIRLKRGGILHVKWKTWSTPNLCGYIQALKTPRCLTEVTEVTQSW